jgi:hypothetical protein
VSKSSGGLFARPGAVTLVDTPLSRAFARKARLTFFTVAIPAAVIVTVASAHWLHPVQAVVLGLFTGVVLGLAAGCVVLAWPVLRLLWHWAAEITAGLILLTGWSRLAGPLGAGWALLGLAAILAVPLAVPAVRRPVWAWLWCVIVRHRLRLCFAEFLRTPGRALSVGRSPLILAARPTPAGERVWVWLRAGLDLTDLEGRAGKLAVGCWADQVVIVRASTSYAALVRVDVTRRDPLTSVVASPLLRLIPGGARPDTSPMPVGSRPGLDLPDVPEYADAAPVPRARAADARHRPPVVEAVDPNDAFI